MKLSFSLNGAPKSIHAESCENLQALLQRMGIHSVRNSDNGEGFSGSDTVLLDGNPVLASLLVAAQIEGRSIKTVESLMKNGRLSVIQNAMLDAGAVQSAYNTPAAALLLDELISREAAPEEADVRDALSGLFNRATGYKQFFSAVQLARLRMKNPDAAVSTAPEYRDDLRLIGKSHRRVDGLKLVAGMKAYVEDRVEPGSCILRMVRSPYAHAYIADIATDEAEAVPGIAAIITYKNCPDILYGQSGQGFPEPSPYDRRMFSRKVRHVGDRVAAVIAENLQAAAEAADRIKIAYDVLEPVLGIDDAIAARAPAIHSDIVYQFDIGADPESNVAASASDSIGDVGRGFDEADVVIERRYETSKVQCTPLEPHVAYTKLDGDRLIIHASTQVPWHVRRIVARVLGIKENQIQVIKERIGGGYGSKQDILLEEVCAFATLLTGRPVFYKYTREEEFIAATTRHPFRIHVRMGAKRDGTITAIKFDVEADTGAYGNHCLTVPMNSCSKSLSLLPCDNVEFSVKSYYTNLPPSGAYQGYGAPQGSFALQMAAAETAAELGMDLLDFLEKNRVREGALIEILKCLGEGKAGSAVRVMSCGLEKALDEGKQMIEWEKRDKDPNPDKKIGKGVVIVQQSSGLPGLDQACVNVKMLGDGTFMIHSGGADLGTGLDTVLVKVAAETLCCDISQVAVLSGDTDNTPFDTGAYASSGTFFTGNAALMAAADLCENILSAASALLQESPDDLKIIYPGVVRGKKSEASFEEIARHCQSGEGPGQLVGSASFTTENNAFPYGAHFCQVAVNTRTGNIEVQKYYALQDCGTPINPDLAIGQVYGGILKSIGHTLYEEMIFDGKGRCLNPTLGNYGAPMIQELPRDMQVRLIQTDDPFGPFGGKSISEVSVNGAAPVIAIAIHDAVGIWLRKWPFTPEKVLKALGRF